MENVPKSHWLANVYAYNSSVLFFVSALCHFGHLTLLFSFYSIYVTVVCSFSFHSYSHSHSNFASTVSYYVAILVVGATFLPLPHHRTWFTFIVNGVLDSGLQFGIVRVYKLYSVQVFGHSVLVVRLLPACHCQNDIGCRAISMPLTFAALHKQLNQIEFNGNEPK